MTEQTKQPTEVRAPAAHVDLKPVVARILDRVPWVREEARLTAKTRTIRMWQYKVSVSLQVMGGAGKAKGGDQPFVEVGLAFDDVDGGTNADSLAEFRQQLGPRGTELGLKLRTTQAGAKCYLSRRFDLAPDADAAYAASADLAVALLELGLGSNAIRNYYCGLRDRHAGPRRDAGAAVANRRKS